MCFGIGTGGITDDINILSIPGVKRSIKSLMKFINEKKLIVENTKTFVKDDIIDDTSEIPIQIINELGDFSNYDYLWKKYGKFLPSLCIINNDENGAKVFLYHILLYGYFRGWNFKTKYREIINNQLFPVLLEVWRKYPIIDWLISYLIERKYIILQGPPGTGKTFLAERVAQEMKLRKHIEEYKTIQFHISISYEDFVEGIKPDINSDKLVFRNNIGPFIESLEKAKMLQKGILLIIDEINRGDLSKILGEAIFLLEPGQKRKITLRSGKEIEIPDNFYILGTMNTADRTIAIIDFAVRRRFAFIDIWPSNKQLGQIYTNSDNDTKKIALDYFNKI